MRPRRGIPKTHLPIIPSRGYILPIRGIGQSGHVVEVTLLFKDVRLTLPFPDQQLA